MVSRPWTHFLGEEADACPIAVTAYRGDDPHPLQEGTGQLHRSLLLGLSAAAGADTTPLAVFVPVCVCACVCVRVPADKPSTNVP